MVFSRWLFDRPADFDAFRKGMYVKELEINLLLFQFFHEVDIQRVMEGSRRTFNKVPLIIDRLKPWDNSKALSLKKLESGDVGADSWFETLNLCSKRCGSTFVESDARNFNGIWREFLRVCVAIKIEKPLNRRIKLMKSSTDWFWANFRYERVPTFCFICGMIGHSDKYCEKLFDQPVETIKLKMLWVVHASHRSSSNKTSWCTMVKELMVSMILDSINKGAVKAATKPIYEQIKESFSHLNKEWRR